ncbi:MAG: ATP-binding protein [Candidatus Leucobacter sulfamidivorax]|nr:ATP-binding protein [Candidatus Leucobacter sulfamidivorax]
MAAPPLIRDPEGRTIAGVCAGLGAHLGIPVLWVRVSMVLFALLGGAGLLFYVWLWVTVPRGSAADAVPPMRRALTQPAVPAADAAASGAAASGATVPAGAATVAVVPAAAPVAAAVDRPGAAALHASSAVSAAAPPSGPPPSAAQPSAAQPSAAQPAAESSASAPGAEPSRRRPRWPIAELLLGGCLLVAGIALVMVQFGAQLHLDIVLPALAVLAGVGLAWWQIADRDRPERHPLPRVLGALALVAVGVLMFFVTAREPNAFTVVAAALAVLAGVALAIAPWVLRVNRELIAERAGRAREAERAEIAAHLHDSVLQTLAAIQQRSEPGSEVARLARGQERELREWLFRAADGAEPPQRDAIAVELRAHAAELEAEHPMRFEIVAVGAEAAVAPEALLGAAREAMLNAARHAGGEVTVYVEIAPDRMSVDVTDRGPGLDPEVLPEGRMGVRESILGRMQRAGGTARIVPGPGGSGTSVRLAIPRDAAASDAGASDTTVGDASAGNAANREAAAGDAAEGQGDER